MTADEQGSDRRPVGGPPQAAIVQRAGARVLQTLIWAVLASLLGWALAGILPDPAPWGVVGAAVVLLAYGPYLGEVLLVALTGWDPGKLVVGLEVRDDAGGGLIPVARAALRSLVLHAPFFLSTALLWVPGPLSDLLGWAYLPWMLFLLWTITRDPDQRGLHDRVAGTVVVQVRGGFGAKRPLA